MKQIAILYTALFCMLMPANAIVCASTDDIIRRGVLNLKPNTLIVSGTEIRNVASLGVRYINYESIEKQEKSLASINILRIRINNVLYGDPKIINKEIYVLEIEECEESGCRPLDNSTKWPKFDRTLSKNDNENNVDSYSQLSTEFVPHKWYILSSNSDGQNIISLDKTLLTYLSNNLYYNYVFSYHWCQVIDIKTESQDQRIRSIIFK